MIEAVPSFEHSNNVCNAGVLFLLPALLSQGLLKAEKIYTRLKKGYYGLVSTILTLAIMFLSRIKCPEQLKTCKVGELGKVIGLDRVPEAKCLRSKIRQIVDQNKAEQFNQALYKDWMSKEDPSFLYVDGHVKVYHGYKANLTKRFVSREKLCLAGTTEFWVNNELGLPYLVVFSELNEKLKDVILNKIIPILLRDNPCQYSKEELERDKDLARFTLVFDREAYDIPFFKKLWNEYRIAVLTYRKSVTDTWPELDFKKCESVVIGKNVSMNLCEKIWEKEGFSFREIRKISNNGHQTSIVTTLPKVAKETLAGKMFSRWSQENFFRYMVQDYDIDKMPQYGLEEVDKELKVVNPVYKKTEYKLKKLREKSARLKAKLYAIVEKNLDADIDTLKQQLRKQAKIQDDISNFENEIKRLCEEKNNIAHYIQIKDMPVQNRYNKLKTESKLLMNTVKMIAFRAETSVANLLTPFYAKSDIEIRMLVKEIIKNDADLIPEYEKKTLTVRLHTLSTPRANRAVMELCKILNDSETIFPGTDLRLIYEMV